MEFVSLSSPNQDDFDDNDPNVDFQDCPLTPLTPTAPPATPLTPTAPPAYFPSANGGMWCSTSYTSLASTSTNVCRICHCGDSDGGGGVLISPCSCSGTLKYVHQSCLQQWIKSANTKSCELCRLDFRMTTSVKPFRKWQKLEMTKVERRKVVCSVTFHAIAITCVVWSLYVLVERAADEVRSGDLEWTFWTKLVVIGVGFTGGVVFMYVQCRMYVQLCRRWRAYNRVIYVQDGPASDEPLPIDMQKNVMSADNTKSDQVVVAMDSMVPGVGESMEMQSL